MPNRTWKNHRTVITNEHKRMKDIPDIYVISTNNTGIHIPMHWIPTLHNITFYKYFRDA